MSKLKNVIFTEKLFKKMLIFRKFQNSVFDLYTYQTNESGAIAIFTVSTLERAKKNVEN